VTVSDELRERILAPPILTADLPGIRGTFRRTPEDFIVEELPAYPLSGRGEHLFFVLEKRGWNTEDAVRELARQLGAPRGEIGVAGRKDKIALTRQWISVPARFGDALARFEHESIRLGEPTAHGNKLRRGHLAGNQFTLRIRLAQEAGALERAHAKLERLQTGLLNYFGEQRFGHEGRNVERGLQLLASGRRKKRGDLLVSAGQSALFNLYAALRHEAGRSKVVLTGDILKKTDTGGLFSCEDRATDQARFDRGELTVTGPMFGSKMMAPPPESPSHAMERDVLARIGLRPDALVALGRAVPGTRRPLWVRPQNADVSLEPRASEEADDSSLCLRFSLPAGSYATVLLRELIDEGRE
jgi:tRNA pseudouridine13 synthase